MSRYTKTVGNRTLHYGFDHALGYWYDVEDNTSKIPLVVLDESTMYTNLNKKRFLEVMEQFDVPKTHQTAVALDLKF